MFLFSSSFFFDFFSVTIRHILPFIFFPVFKFFVLLLTYLFLSGFLLLHLPQIIAFFTNKFNLFKGRFSKFFRLPTCFTLDLYRQAQLSSLWFLGLDRKCSSGQFRSTFDCEFYSVCMGDAVSNFSLESFVKFIGAFSNRLFAKINIHGN